MADALIYKEKQHAAACRQYDPLPASAYSYRELEPLKSFSASFNNNTTTNHDITCRFCHVSHLELLSARGVNMGSYTT